MGRDNRRCRRPQPCYSGHCRYGHFRNTTCACGSPLKHPEAYTDYKKLLRCAAMIDAVSFKEPGRASKFLNDLRGFSPADKKDEQKLAEETSKLYNICSGKGHPGVSASLSPANEGSNRTSSSSSSSSRESRNGSISSSSEVSRGSCTRGAPN